MKTKPNNQSTTKPYPFERFLHDFPTRVLVEATIDAQRIACQAVRNISSRSAKVELFWVTYNFEFRKIIERWSESHAD